MHICNIYIGYSTFAFSKALTDRGSGGRVIGIDAFVFVVQSADVSAHVLRVRNTYEYVTDLMALTKITNMEVVKGYFDEVAASWQHGKSIDILHVDGRHEYENVKKDYQDFLPFVKEDGIIIFHDCYVWDQLDFGVHTFLKELDDHLYKGYFINDYGLGVVTNNGALFNAIRKQYPQFQLGYPTPPPHAHPSYFRSDKERILEAQQRDSTQFLSDKDVQKLRDLGKEEIIVDISDLYTLNEINIILALPGRRVVERVGSITQNWEMFWSNLEDGLDLETNVSEKVL